MKKIYYLLINTSPLTIIYLLLIWINWDLYKNFVPMLFVVYLLMLLSMFKLSESYNIKSKNEVYKQQKNGRRIIKTIRR